MGITAREREEIARANDSGRQPVVFVHGLWLLADSWSRWCRFFEDAGFTTVAPGWPDEPETVDEARKVPRALAHKSVKEAADHFAAVTEQLKVQPAIVGHSFGGLIAEILAGRGLSSATVAISPAPFRGVLSLPFSALKAASPVLSNPANYDRAVALTFEQFRFAFANAVTETEARELYETFAVPAPGLPLFQAALANLNPWSEVKVNTKSPRRGPMLVISADKDNTVPRKMSHGSFLRQERNEEPTEFLELPNRGHSLTIDSGWQDVADAALEFIRKHLLLDAPLPTRRAPAAPTRPRI
jgi:pimeloyl-ACP methyl ester carboxylesterase